MVLEKDPTEDVTQLEEMTYKEFFSDINTPGIWKAETEEDLKTAKIIVLDGHSTILVYNQSDEDLPWTAYNELGQYKYTPDNIGDGIVIFSHTFYFEFKVSIGNQIIIAESTFDGNSIEAIALPMKDVSIDDLFSVMTNRIEDAVNSEIQLFDDTIGVSLGEKIKIPESISMKIGMKLSLMGIILTGLKAKEITELEIKKEDSVVEEVFEEQSSKMKDMLEDEEKELKKRKRAKSKKKVAPKTAEISTPKAAKRSGAGPVTKASPPPSTLAGPPPPTAKPTSAGPPPVASRSVVSAPAVTPPPVSPPSVSPPPVSSPGPTPPPPTNKELSATMKAPPAAKSKSAESTGPVAGLASGMGEIDDEEEEMPMDTSMAIADDDEMEDGLIAKGMAVSDKPMTLRYTHTSYFSRMLLNRAYPLVVKISMDEVGIKQTITSVVTGERVTEKEEALVFSEEDPNVTIRPEFPGCFVVPTEQVVDITKDKIEVKFHVTPLALGTLDGVVKFVQAGKFVHSMNLETKVITHRISKWLATFGGAASAIPFLIAFALDETIPQFMEKRLDRYMPSVSRFGGLIMGGITVLFLFLSGYVYRLQKPSRTTSSLAFPR